MLNKGYRQSGPGARQPGPRRLLGLLAALVLGAAGAPLLAADASGQPRVSGVVRAAHASAVQGATVYATEVRTGIIVSTHTAPDGGFSIPLRGPGDYSLSASAKGYRAGDPRTVRVEREPLDAGTLALTLEPVVPADQLTSADIIPRLPGLDTPGGRRVSQSCSQCHSISALLWRGGRTEEDWNATVERMGMVAGGYFPIRDETRKELVAYLSSHLGPDSALPAAVGRAVAQEPRALPSGTDVVFTEYEIPSALALAHTAAPDHRGSVWFASFGAGNVGRLDLASGRVTEYVPKTPGIRPHGITVGADGTVWYSAMPYGIGRIDPRTGAMEEFKAPDPTESARGTPHTIIVARDGKVWFSELSNGSITRFDPETRAFRRYQIEERSGPYALLEREDNVFWFVLSRASKIGFLDANTGRIRTWSTPTLNANPQRFRFDSTGRLWFGEYGAGKIGVFDPKTEAMTEYALPSGGSAYCLHVDEEDHVWVASTQRESLIRFDPATQAMTEYPLPGAGADADLLGPIVRDIWPDETGKMWFVEWSRNKVASAEILRR